MTVGAMATNPLFWAVVFGINIAALALAWLLKRVGRRFLATRAAHKSDKRKEELEALAQVYIQKPLLRQGLILDLAFHRWLSMLSLIIGIFLGIVIVILIPSLAVRGVDVPEWVGASVTAVAVGTFILFGLSVSECLDTNEVLMRAYTELTKQQLAPSKS